MIRTHKIRVLVIDDSLLFRETVARKLAEDPGIEVVGTAADPFMARDLIIEHEPDVLTLDVEMPKMSGIEFLRRLMPQYPMPVVMVSSADSRVFEALKAGAVEFVKKPDGSRPDRLDSMIRELVIKIKIASTAKLGNQKQLPRQEPLRRMAAGRAAGCDLIAMGASTGGTEAVDKILRLLPPDMPPILIVQHMPSVFTRLYAERLNQVSRLQVSEATDGMLIRRGQVIVAAGEKHLTVRQSQNQLWAVSRPGEKISGHCPSVDRLFQSIAAVQELNVLALLLTGMGQDGARGLLSLRQQGARTITQDEASCVVYGMPKAAFELGAAEYQVSLMQIPDLIMRIMAGE